MSERRRGVQYRVHERVWSNLTLSSTAARARGAPFDRDSSRARPAVEFLSPPTTPYLSTSGYGATGDGVLSPGHVESGGDVDRGCASGLRMRKRLTSRRNPVRRLHRQGLRRAARHFPTLFTRFSTKAERPRTAAASYARQTPTLGGSTLLAEYQLGEESTVDRRRSDRGVSTTSSGQHWH